MELDIQPLDIQALDSDELDIQPLDIQPLDAPKKERNVGDKSIGILEAGMSTVAGLPSMIAGGLGGIVGMAGQGAANLAGIGPNRSPLETGNKFSDVIQDFNFGLGRYKPATETGQEYAEKVGNVMAIPVDKAGELGQKIGGDLGEANARVAAETVMNFLPLGIGFKGMKGSAGAISRIGEKGPAVATNRVGALDDIIAKKNAAPEAVPVPGEQMSLDIPRVEVRGTADSIDPAQAAAGPMRPEIVPEPINRRQTEFNFGEGLPEQINVDRVGEAVRSDVNPNDLAGREAVTQQVAADLDAQLPLRNQTSLETPDGQMSMFDQADQMGQRNQFNGGELGDWRIDENGMPVRADISMEAANLENPLQKNLWGDELGPALGQERSLTEAIDSLPSSPFFDDVRDNALSRLNPTIPSSFNTRTRGQGGGLYLGEQIKRAKEEAPNRWYTASPEAGRRNTYSLSEQALRPNANEQRYGPGQYLSMSRDFSSVYGGPEGRMYTVDRPFDRPFDVTNATNQKIYDSLVERAGSRTAANQALERAGYDAIVFTSPRGDKLANIFNEKPLKDIGPAREKIREQQLSIAEYEPGQPTFNQRTRKQGGGIRVPGNKARQVEQMKRLPGLKSKMWQFLPDTLSTDEFLAQHKSTPDVQQNAAQRVANLFTKGGDYQAIKTGNPLIKRVVDLMKEADGRAKGNIQKFVRNLYAKELRGFSKEEYTDTWAALKKMEAAGVKLSPDELVNAGFNQKQRDFIKTHQDMMDVMIPKIQKVMEETGMGKFNPEAAYVASKASGQFRKLVYKTDENGVQRVAGIVGANTRGGLAKELKKYTDLHPEYSSGPEMTFMGGGKGRLADGFEDMLKLLGDQDPTVKEFIQRSKEVMDRDTQNYRGAKTHTMAKKGIEGMEGNKPWEDAYTNAKEGFDAQIAYFNRMFEWSEKAAAMAEIKPLLVDGNGLNMPNAKAYARDYVDMAMGRNPTLIGRTVDQLFDAFGKQTGLGTAGIGKAASEGRQLLNLKLLGLSPGYWLGNAMDIIKNTPEMGSYLRTLGVNTSAPTILMNNFKAAMDVAKFEAGFKVSPIIKDAIKYADDNHVYASDLFEHSSDSRVHWGNKVKDVAQWIPSRLEGATRQNSFLGYVHTLHESGIKPEDGLYQAAAKLTDITMNNYNTIESPMGLQNLGAASRAPYNLLSYKFNQLSRMAMLARPVMSTGDFRPIATALMMQATFAGLKGMILYQEADFIVEQISRMMDKPTSLTKLMLDHVGKIDVPLVGEVDPAYGAFDAVGADMTNRLGTGLLLGDLSKPQDVLLPGASAIGVAAESAMDLIKDPTEFHAKRAAIDILPGGALLERKFFSKTTPDGREFASSRTKGGKAMAERNEADKRWKSFGITGSNESRQKTALWENQKIDKFYQEQQLKAVEKMKETFFTDQTIDQEAVNKYIKAQGNAKTIGTTIKRIAMEQNIPAPQADALAVAASKAVNAGPKMARRFN